MTLSRLAPPLLLLLTPAGADAAREITAEQAMSNYRKLIKPVRELDCPRGGGSDEIVVCGRSESEAQRERLPLPVAREPGERIPGEPAMNSAGCIRLCEKPVTVPLNKVPAFIGKMIERLKDR